MTFSPVEWVLVVFYGVSAHRATYGRLEGTKYTKDYIQLSRKTEFLDDLDAIFGMAGNHSIPLTYRWPLGSAPGHIFSRSADRPHLSWVTAQGAPAPWRMLADPNEATVETIPGDPTHQDESSADAEFSKIEPRGAGQPYLVAVKLKGEANTLHLRTYLAGADHKYHWASIDMVPTAVQELASKTRANSALAWSRVKSGGILPSDSTEEALKEAIKTGFAPALIDKIEPVVRQSVLECLEAPAMGIFFDPSRNHDAWRTATPLPSIEPSALEAYLGALSKSLPSSDLDSDFSAENIGPHQDLVVEFEAQVESENYEVLDTKGSVKIRGSAQHVFAKKVKGNYQYHCAITGISNPDFLVASHIVPWSEDEKIRLDPSNGICLSLIVDRAFEKGYLFIEDSYEVKLNWENIANDPVLKSYLAAYDGIKINLPKAGLPNPKYLQRRRSSFK